MTNRHLAAFIVIAIATVAFATSACGPKNPPVDPDGNGNGNGNSDQLPVDWAASGIDWSKPPQPGPEPVFAVPRPASFNQPLPTFRVDCRRLPFAPALHRHFGGAHEQFAGPGMISVYQHHGLMRFGITKARLPQ